MGIGCEYVCCIFLSTQHCVYEEFLRGIALPLSIQDVVCRGMVVKGWNPGAGGEVVVVPVIGQYLELGYFCTARWLERPCHCPGNFERLCFR